MQLNRDAQPVKVVRVVRFGLRQIARQFAWQSIANNGQPADAQSGSNLSGQIGHAKTIPQVVKLFKSMCATLPIAIITFLMIASPTNATPGEGSQRKPKSAVLDASTNSPDCSAAIKERAALIKAGIGEIVKNGPAADSTEPDSDKFSKVRRFIRLQEMILFKCPPLPHSVALAIKKPPLPIKHPLGRRPKPTDKPLIPLPVRKETP